MARRTPTAPRLRAVAPPEAAHGGEAALVERARGGDPAAWERLYQDHFDGIYRDLAFLVFPPSVAEELVQETFAAAIRSIRRFDGGCQFATWLRGIAHNLVRKHWRTHVRRSRAYDALEELRFGSGRPGPRDVEGAHLDRRRAAVLQAVLETLPGGWREAFVLCDVQGLSPAEAAERLGIKPGNVRVRAARARARIRCELERLGWITSSEVES